MSQANSLLMTSPSWSGRLRSIPHQQPLLLLASATVSGVILDSLFDIAAPETSTVLRSGLWVVAILVCLFFVFLSSKPKSYSSVLATLVMMGSFGALDHHWQTRSYDDAGILTLIDAQYQPTVVEGVVDCPVVLRPHPRADQARRENQSPWQTQMELSVERIRLGREFQDVSGRVLLTLDGRRDELLPGDRLRVYGNLRGITPATNPGEANFFDFYRRRRLHGRIEVDSPEQLELIGSSSLGYRFSRWTASIAARGRDGLLQELDDTTGPLAVALVIGQRDFVDDQTSDQLLVTGTAHLLSVSGMHLAIVVAMTTWIAMLLRLPMTAKVALVIAVCIFYCAITGARPPVMRAAVLVSTLMFAIWMRRPGQAINTLSLAAIVLVLLNPENVFSVGVQLSFLAVATLVLCSGRRAKGSAAVDAAIRQEESLAALAEASRSRPIIYLRYAIGVVGQLFWFSACVAMVSMPLVWHQFNVVSWISIPTNVVLGPLLFVALASGIATVGGVILYQPVAMIPASVCHASLWAMGTVIDVAAAVPGGHFWLPAPPTWWVIIFYVVLAASLGLPLGRKSRAIRCSWIALWMVAAFGMATHSPELKPGTIEATFVDVGHGTSVVLRCDGNDVWLYDCGRLGNDVGSSRDIEGVLWSLGVTRLNGIFLSHADADHFNALPGLLRRFGVDQICTPPGMLSEPEFALDAIREAINRAGVPVHQLSQGDVVEAERITMRILHPPAQRILASDNANSLVVSIERGGKTLMLPGDLEPPGTEILIQQDRPPPGGVLMAPHHGSLQMDAETVLRWSRPAQTVVSGGRRAGRPEVAEMLQSSGSGLYVTSRDGAIRVQIADNGDIEVRSWLNSPW